VTRFPSDVVGLEELGFLDEAEEMARSESLRWGDIRRLEYERWLEAEKKRKERARRERKPVTA
jgi:hypothetical protein